MKNKSFLLVNNNSIALRELSDIMKYLTYDDIHQAENANTAWAMMRVKPFGCVIAAWDMPDMSGLALLKIARSDDRFFSTPFFLTDPAFTKVKVIQAGQSGVTGLLVSPFNVKNIQQKMDVLAEASLQDQPSEAEIALQKGLAMVEKEDYREAISVLEDLTEKGETAEYYYNLGYLKTSEEKYTEAIEAFQKATRLDRLFAKAYEAMGHAYQQLGRQDEAQKYLQKAADLYMSKENVQDAEEVLNEILKIGKDTVNVYNSLGVLYRKKGDPETALKHYKKAIKVHPREPFIHYNIGRLYLDMKDPVQAKKYFSLAVGIKPDFEEAREVLNAIELGTI
ncbi:MAG: tetratricopeptide repeat protein [Pseudomonadota bacterium]